MSQFRLSSSGSEEWRGRARCSAVNNMDGGRGERGIKTPGREVFRDKHICARGIVWMWELTTQRRISS